MQLMDAEPPKARHCSDCTHIVYSRYTVAPVAFILNGLKLVLSGCPLTLKSSITPFRGTHSSAGLCKGKNNTILHVLFLLDNGNLF